MSETIKRTLLIVNSKGLHARASRKFAEVALQYDSKIVVRRDDGEADATSLMDLMMLGAGVGSTIDVEAEGPQAEDAMAALAALVEDGFGERD